MASLGMGMTGAVALRSKVKVNATASTRNSGGGGEEKGLLEWLLGSLQRDQLLETDPVLNKVEDKSAGATRSRGGTTSVSVPNKKSGSGGFGGLFAKK